MRADGPNNMLGGMPSSNDRTKADSTVAAKPGLGNREQPDARPMRDVSSWSIGYPSFPAWLEHTSRF